MVQNGVAMKMERFFIEFHDVAMGDTTEILQWACQNFGHPRDTDRYRINQWSNDHLYISLNDEDDMLLLTLTFKEKDPKVTDRWTNQT